MILPPDTRELCELVDDWDGEFVMLKAFFDESGIHKDSPVCVVAGFVANTQNCGKLSWGWRELLARYQLKYFHAKEYANHGGEFKERSGWAAPGYANKLTWNYDLRRQFEIDAIAVINDALDILDDPIIIGAAINTADFFALPLDKRRWLTGGYMSKPGNWKRQGAPTKPYFLGFQQAILDAAKYSQARDAMGRHLGTGELVHFVFDQQHEYEKSAHAIFNAMKSARLSIKGRIGDAVFTSKLRQIPLQVADFIAYESYSYLYNRIVRKRDELRSESAGRLFNRDMRSVYIDREQLERMLRECPPRPKALFTLPDPTDNRVALGLPGTGIAPRDDGWGWHV